jgi:hypothetical protein
MLCGQRRNDCSAVVLHAGKTTFTNLFTRSRLQSTWPVLPPGFGNEQADAASAYAAVQVSAGAALLCVLYDYRQHDAQG